MHTRPAKRVKKRVAPVDLEKLTDAELEALPDDIYAASIPRRWRRFDTELRKLKGLLHRT